MASKSLATLTFPFHGGMYVGNFVTEGIGGKSFSFSYASIWQISTCKYSTPSSDSTVMDLPFSFIKKFSNRRFLGDTRTSPIVYLSFLDHGFQGDFGTSSTSSASPVSFTIWGSVTSVVSSVNRTPGLVVVIMFSLDLFGHTLKGDKSARHSLLYNCLNLKQSVVSWLALGFYRIF